MPQDLDSLNTAYGSEADLRACLAALHYHNILAIADVVINHRCAQQKARLTRMCGLPVESTDHRKRVQAVSILPMVVMRSCMTHVQPACVVPEQGPDGKWNQYTGRYAWDASCIVSNQREEFGGTGALKKEALFGAAPNMDHSNASS